MTKLLHFSLRGMVHGLVWGTADILLRISASGVRPSERVAARPSASGDAFPRQRRCVNTQARYIPVQVGNTLTVYTLTDCNTFPLASK